VDLLNPAQANWKEVLPERKSVLQGIGLVGGNWSATGWKMFHTKIEILTPDGKLVRELKLPSLGVAFGPFGRWDSGGGVLSVHFLRAADDDLSLRHGDGAQSTWSQVKMPFDSASVEVKQVWYESKDKTRVPMYIAHKKGLKLDGRIRRF
jgi:prolyl oligopeptidase